MKRFFFQEVQKFRQFWVWFTLLMSFGVFPVVLILQLGFGIEIGTNPIPNSALAVMSLIGLLVTGMMLASKMETEITDTGIKYRFFPFQIAFREISWEDVQSAEIRTYKPLKEYGGWGIRYGKNGRAINVNGNQGLQLVLKNGKRLLLGTGKADELSILLNHKV